MTHRVVAIKCSYVRGKLSLTAIGESPRGTKVFLRKEVIDHYEPGQAASKEKARSAVDRLLFPPGD